MPLRTLPGLSLLLGGLLGLGCFQGRPGRSGAPATPALSPQARWVQAAAKPFATSDPLAKDDDLVVLDPMLGEATLVGLGEATHGSSEFFRMKHRLLRYLVEHKGFTAFGMEADLASCRALDAYVRLGEGDPRALVEAMAMWPWNTEEMLGLVAWMRAHNRKVPEARKVRFFGFDLQDGDAAADQLLAYLAPLDPEAAAALTTCYAPYRPFMGLRNPQRASYRLASKALRDRCRLNLQLARLWLQDHRDAYVAAAGAEGYGWALRMAELLVQHEAFHGAEAYPHPIMALNERDRSMADNVDWAVQHLGPGTRAVLWAHNGHINKKGAAAPLWTNTGDWLVQRHGAGYLSVGFAFGSGGFNAVAVSELGEPGLLQPFHVPPSGEDAYEQAFLAAGVGNAFLDLRNLDLTDLGACWFNDAHGFREVGSSHLVRTELLETTTHLVSRFDVLVFFRTVSPSRLLRQDQMPLFPGGAADGILGSHWAMQ
jgi:erythromycin esterase